jgi:hypothetical protein
MLNEALYLSKLELLYKSIFGNNVEKLMGLAKEDLVNGSPSAVRSNMITFFGAKEGKAIWSSLRNNSIDTARFNMKHISIK